MAIKDKKIKPIRIIIQQTGEAIDFSGFIGEVINHEENKGANKGPFENGADCKNKSWGTS